MIENLDDMGMERLGSHPRFIAKTDKRSFSHRTVNPKQLDRREAAGHHPRRGTPIHRPRPSSASSRYRERIVVPSARSEVCEVPCNACTCVFMSSHLALGPWQEQANRKSILIAEFLDGTCANLFWLDHSLKAQFGIRISNQKMLRKQQMRLTDSLSLSSLGILIVVGIGTGTDWESVCSDRRSNAGGCGPVSETI